MFNDAFWASWAERLEDMFGPLAELKLLQFFCDRLFAFSSEGSDREQQEVYTTDKYTDKQKGNDCQTRGTECPYVSSHLFFKPSPIAVNPFLNPLPINNFKK